MVEVEEAEEVAAASGGSGGGGGGWRRKQPLRRCRDRTRLIQHLPKTTTVEFESDYEYSCDFPPQELLREILLRLPSVESIIKCTAVCKSWRSMIKNPTFIDAHLSRSRSLHDDDTKGSLLLLVERASCWNRNYWLYWNKPSAFGIGSDGEFFPLNDTNGKSTIATPDMLAGPIYDEETGAISTTRYFNLAGTCNGLICFANDNHRLDEIPTIICNPLLRKFVALPRTRIAIQGYVYVGQMSAFGYDPRTNDYKVLRILASRWCTRDTQFEFGVELYSLARGSWKSLIPAATAIPGCFDMCKRILGTRRSPDPSYSHVFGNAALHWLLRCDSTTNYQETVIVSFDLVTESFQEINIPQVLTRRFCRGVYLSVHEDSLALIEVDLLRPGCDLHLWIMQQSGSVPGGSSWTKLYTVSLGDLKQYGHDVPHPSLFGFKSNGEQVFRLGYEARLVLLKVDFKTKQVCRGLDLYSKHDFMDSFVESLVLLNQSNAISY